jgi:hypothetical protein
MVVAVAGCDGRSVGRRSTLIGFGGAKIAGLGRGQRGMGRAKNAWEGVMRVRYLKAVV